MTAKSAADAGTIQSIATGPIIFAIRKLSGLWHGLYLSAETKSLDSESRDTLNCHNSKNPSIWPSLFIYCQRDAPIFNPPARRQKPTPIIVRLLPPPPPPPLGATASWARGASWAGLAGRGCSRSA